MNSSFFRSALHVNVGMTAARRGPLPGHLVHLFVEVSTEAVFAATATLSDVGTSGETFTRSRLHSHNLRYTKKSGWTATGALNSQEQCQTFFYPSFFTGATRCRRRWATSTPAASAHGGLRKCVRCASQLDVARSFSTDPHPFVMADVESSSKDAYKVFIEDYAAWVEFVIRAFDPQANRLKEVWLIIFRINVVPNLLRALFQKRDDDLMETVQENKYQ